MVAPTVSPNEGYSRRVSADRGRRTSSEYRPRSPITDHRDHRHHRLPKTRQDHGLHHRCTRQDGVRRVAGFDDGLRAAAGGARLLVVQVAPRPLARGGCRCARQRLPWTGSNECAACAQPACVDRSSFNANAHGPGPHPSGQSTPTRAGPYPSLPFRMSAVHGRSMGDHQRWYM